MDLNQIISKCKLNDRTAQCELFDLIIPKMMTTARRYCKDQAQAQDIVQTAFIKILEKLSSYNNQGNKFFSWIHRITVNTALQELRKPYYRVHDFNEYSDSDASLEPEVFHKLSEEQILKVIAQLPDGYKEVFNMAEIDGYSHKEIAQKLNIEVSSSRSRLSRAKQMLREKISGLYLKAV